MINSLSARLSAKVFVTEAAGLCTTGKGGLGRDTASAGLDADATAAAAAAAYLMGGNGAAVVGRTAAGDCATSAGLLGSVLMGLTGVSILTGASTVVSASECQYAAAA